MLINGETKETVARSNEAGAIVMIHKRVTGLWGENRVQWDVVKWIRHVLCLLDKCTCYEVVVFGWHAKVFFWRMWDPLRLENFITCTHSGIFGGTWHEVYPRCFWYDIKRNIGWWWRQCFLVSVDGTVSEGTL
jgi:hypothetical protein